MSSDEMVLFTETVNKWTSFNFKTPKSLDQIF